MKQAMRTRVKTYIRKCPGWKGKTIPFLLLFISYFLTVYAYWLNGKTLLDADEASEMILAQHLNEEGGILSKTWYYSTELRVINTQLVYKIGIRIFPTDWHAARTFSIAILMLILLVSYLYFVRQLGLGKYGLWTAIALMVPFSTEYSYTVLYGGFYVPHISIIFVGLGLFLQVLQMQHRIGRIMLFVLSVLLAFGSGLGGVRQFLVLYAPLFMTVFLLMVKDTIHSSHLGEIIGRRTGKTFLFVASILISCLAGVAVNSKFLSKIYTFEDYSDVSLNSIDLSRFWGYLDSWFQLMGYEGCAELRDITGMAAICGLILCFLAAICAVIIVKVRARLTEGERIVALFSIVSLLLNTFFYLLANNPMPRYLMPAVVMTFPVIGMGLKYLPEQNGVWSKIGIAVLIFCVLGQSTNYMYYHAFKDHGTLLTAEEKVAYWLADHGYRNGYATFWNANNMVELTDGKLEMWGIETEQGEILWYELENSHWLQVKAHDTRMPDGKVFLLLNQEEKNEGNDAKTSLVDQRRLVYQEDGYYVYTFDSADEMYSLK